PRPISVEIWLEKRSEVQQVTMSSEAIREAVERLVESRRTGNALPGFPESCRPETLADGYAVQDAFVKAWMQPVAGWKVGCTAVETQQLFGIGEPFYGPVLAPVVFRSPAALPAADFAMRGIECEFTFRLMADSEPREKPYRVEEAAERVSAPIPAIEVVSPRLDHPVRHGAPSAIADCGVNGALVLGSVTLDWQALDLATHAVRLEVDGERKAAGTGALVLGHPLNVLAWFVNRYTGSGRTLPAGQIVSTGTTTGLLMLEPGQTAVGDFGALGKVELRFVA
ncbi:MAG TPA: fumarylacetoacetate hydrolase family protein, partial [Geminicoccaceae bacterium]|nr:fumarylacetoacetate hydrolase family protein [Geminicoccaceae bacterium]